MGGKSQLQGQRYTGIEPKVHRRDEAIQGHAESGQTAVMQEPTDCWANEQRSAKMKSQLNSSWGLAANQLGVSQALAGTR